MQTRGNLLYALKQNRGWQAGERRIVFKTIDGGEIVVDLDGDFQQLRSALLPVLITVAEKSEELVQFIENEFLTGAKRLGAGQNDSLPVHLLCDGTIIQIIELVKKIGSIADTLATETTKRVPRNQLKDDPKQFLNDQLSAMKSVLEDLKSSNEQSRKFTRGEIEAILSDDTVELADQDSGIVGHMVVRTERTPDDVLQDIQKYTLIIVKRLRKIASLDSQLTHWLK